MKDQFLQIITRSDGRINPQTIKESYFQKINKKYLWDYYINETKIFNEYEHRDRIFFWKNNINQIKKCYCGNNCITINYKKDKSYSNYCSSICARKDKNIKKISATKRCEITAANKRKRTMIEKYGVEYNSQRDDIKHIWKKNKVSDIISEKLNDENWLREHYVIKKLTSVQIGDMLGCFYGTVIFHLKKFGIDIQYYRNTSSHENELYSFIKSLGNFEIIQSDREIIGLELDLYLPQYKLAIELNGTYWHSYSFKETKEDKERHSRKSKLCKDKGIFLLHITDIEWKNNKELIQSMIINRLGLSKRIYARKCKGVKLSNNEYVNFCLENHISGSARASHRYGLVYDGKIVSILSFNKNRFNKEADWEIIRLCSLKEHMVVGGFSKMLSMFIEEVNPNSICSYSDIRYGTGKVYLNNGFNYIRTTDPGYSWTDTKITLNRYLCQKSKLPKLLGDNFNINETEEQNMFRNGFRRMWDCGHDFFIMRKGD